PLTYGRSYVHPPFILDFFFFFAGCWALTGPHEAKGPLGGELSVQCSYVRGYETYIKYWCRGTMQISCHVVVQTSDSEAIVKQDRVSIRDIRTNNTFIVTMKNLTEGDSGIYWCGIEELGWDRMFSVKVSVLPGKFLHDSGTFIPESLELLTQLSCFLTAVSASPMPAPEKEPKVDATCMESPCTWTVLQVTESNSTVHSSDPSAR
uniref:Immunoglobulin domain-containing protein n=1 Tax=Pelusios castaneus TaxID=367368 RepID=A0A8C8SCH8_9SAUR